MRGVVDQILSAPGWLVYSLVGALVFAEDALFIGFVLPAKPPRSWAVSPPTEDTSRCTASSLS